MEEPQPNDLRQTLSHGVQGTLRRLKALETRAIEWCQALELQYKKLLVGLGVSLVLIVVILAVWKIPQRQLAPLKAEIQRERNNLQPQERLRLEHDARKLEHGARTTLVQAFGGLALLLGVYLSAKSWWTTREGQVTDRFTRAINQLGETGPEKLAIRLGGIYALERIARDSKRDHWTIMEVLTAYVRVNAPWKAEEQDSQPQLASDIRAILTVLGRRTRTYHNGEPHRLDLAHTDLCSADLAGTSLEGALLTGAHIEDATLMHTHLEGAILTNAHLKRAVLIGTCLDGADLTGANLEGVWGLTVEQLASVKTLYRARLDPPLLEQIQQQHPHLLEESRLT
jgi:Pentapeptide repeats (8 copies)